MRVTKFRSVFISDLHLGFRMARADACLEFLRSIETENLFLIGDTIDGWRMWRHWFWPAAHDSILDRLFEMEQAGTSVVLLSGNHDDFFRDQDYVEGSTTQIDTRIRERFGPRLFGFERYESHIYETAAGKKLFLTHGDLFDDVDKRSRGLSIWGGLLFDSISRFLPNRLCHLIRRFFKSLMAKPERIRNKIAVAAQERNCDGLIYGHVHRPTLELENEFLVGNTGDWVENESYLVEHFDGSLELFNFGKSISRV